jgi:hypothetical protein
MTTLKVGDMAPDFIGKDGRIRDVVGSDIPVARDIGKLIEKTRAA